MSLSREETARYARHIVLKDMGGAGQQRLKSARVLVVGAGGLGSPVIAYLAAAGLGHMTIADPDTVSVSNLQRQIVHRTGDAGLPKAESAVRFVAALNPHVVARAEITALDASNAAAILAGHDLVIEGTDSFAARQAIAAACEAAELPLVTGAIGQFDGALTVLAPHLADAAGVCNPRFADLYPVAPRPDEAPACETVGVLGVLPGIVGAMMANEAIKLITGIGAPLIGKLLVYSARSGETTVLRYKQRG